MPCREKGDCAWRRDGRVDCDKGSGKCLGECEGDKDCEKANRPPYCRLWDLKCVKPQCGNGVLEKGELCDEGADTVGCQACLLYTSPSPRD